VSCSPTPAVGPLPPPYNYMYVSVIHVMQPVANIPSQTLLMFFD
jgi:hypothetical protein